MPLEEKPVALNPNRNNNTLKRVAEGLKESDLDMAISETTRLDPEATKGKMPQENRENEDAESK